MSDTINKSIFVIFGGTGDLTKRKLIPALYNLFLEEKLSKNFAIVSIGRRDYSEKVYIDMMEESCKTFSKESYNKGKWDSFKKRISYLIFDFSTTCKGYDFLKNYLEKLNIQYEVDNNIIYYLAVPPSSFEAIISNLKCNNMIEKDKGWQRVMVEKPFGSDLTSAQLLNENISKNIKEENIFRIDHYLGKEMIQNIMAIRFGNSIFEPLWNHNYIDNIQIISSETIGVESRGAYYDQTGILKDMLQNHILQMLSLIAMEAPINLSPESIRDEKVKAIKSLRLFDEKSAKKNIVLGQYGKKGKVKGYKEEDKVDNNSSTPTFIAMKANLDNFRWSGVPFYIKAGKALDKKHTKIIIQFKKLPGTSNYEEFNNTKANVLVILIQPTEGMTFQINAKKPGNDFFVNKVEMDYCQKSKYQSNTTKAYERLILEAIRNNSSLFTRWDELLYSWKYIESIEKAIDFNDYNFPNYKFGSSGPINAEKLMDEEGNKWWKE